jgi:hypothetical protein
MKTQLSIIILLLACLTNLNGQDIFGKWIKTKVEYVDKSELPNENSLKFQYVRYSFEKPNKFYMSLTYDDKGTALLFERKNNIIEIKNSFGFVTNSFLIAESGTDELVLIQKGITSFTENDCIKLYFTKESKYQNSLQVRPIDILSINNLDTVYMACEKVHPEFNWEKSFYDFCTENMPEKKAVVATNNFFLATFIVRKTGLIDSVKVLEGINSKFEKQFRATLKKSQRFWAPAKLGDKNVDVQMKMTFKFISSDKFIPMYDFSKKGKTAMTNSDFDGAIYYFDLALEENPDDYEILYNKAICELNLGNRTLACQDLKKVKASGKLNVDDLILKECM